MNKSYFDGASLTDVERRIEDGTIFEGGSILDIANAGGVGKWMFRTGAKAMILKSREITSNGDELTYEGFGFPTLTNDGTPITVTRRNALNRTEPTVTDNGTPAPPVYMPGASGSGNSTVGQFNQDGLVRILPAHTDFLMQVTNNGSANPATTQLYLLWAELSDPSKD